MVKRFSLFTIAFLQSLLFAQEVQLEQLETKLRGSVYCPSFYKGNIVVCSDQKDRITKTILDENGKEPVDLYLINPDSPQEVKRFDEHFRSLFNDGPIAFNKKGDRCVISRNLKTDRRYKSLEEDFNPLGLYTSHWSDSTGWSILIPLPFNNPAYFCSHPTMNEAGDLIIFSSNMPGGFGGFDLWKSELINGHWSQPVNLGSEINTEANELFPNLNNRILFFSSKRDAYGGLDIYRANWEEKEVKVKALKPPFNSPQDDFGLISKDFMNSGYLSSNRSGTDALWQFKVDYPDFAACQEMVMEDFCYTLFEENARELDDVGSLVYEWSINGVKRRGVEIRYCFPGPGDYEINLDIIDTLIGQTYFNQAAYSITLEREQQAFIECPDTVFPGEVFYLSAEATNLPTMDIHHYYWNFGDGTKGKFIETSHYYETEGTYQVVLGLTGYEGEADAETCVYKTIVCSSGKKPEVDPNLIPSQIANPDLVTDVSYFNIPPNDSGYVIYSIEAIRSDSELDLNKLPYQLLEKYAARVEYDSLENNYIYFVGQYEEFTEAHNTWKILQDAGFEESIVRTLLLDIDDPTITFDKKFVLKNVQFDSGKSDLRDEAIAELQKIVQLMKSAKSLHLSISAHTDNAGSEEYNMKLSLDRAIAVKDYLVANEIAAERIRAEGFGATEPIDSNDTKKGRQNNRRVEFKLEKQ